MGMRDLICADFSGSAKSDSVNSVRTQPGATPLQRIPRSDHSLLSARIAPPIPDLAAAYAGMFGTTDCQLFSDPMKMWLAGRPAANCRRPSSWLIRNGAVRCSRGPQPRFRIATHSTWWVIGNKSKARRAVSA